MNDQPVCPFQKSEIVGQRIVRIVVKDGNYEGYLTLDAGFVLENGIAFGLSFDSIFEFHAETGSRDWMCDEIRGNPIRSIRYRVYEDGEAELGSIFIELMDGSCVWHVDCVPPGLSPDIYVNHRTKLGVPDERIRDFFDQPMVIPE